MLKAVICHAGRRDLYQAAWALREAGLLNKLVTDLYCDISRLTLSRRLINAWPKLGTYACPGLKADDVHTPAKAVLRALRLKFDATRSRQIAHDQHLGQVARRIANQTGSPLLSYSYYAWSAFAPGPGLPDRRILFQLHPHPRSVKALLAEELERVPESSKSLLLEHELGSTEEHFEQLAGEPLLANAWIVASQFTARTLSENGIPFEKIRIVPYGVDFNSFPCRTIPPPPNQPLRLAWVGSLVQRKGLTYLLDAVSQFSAAEVELILCTHNPVELELVQKRNLSNVRVKIGLPVPEMVRQLHQCNMFVLPSLAEGFAAVILEAMSCGLPVLTTPNTFGPEVIKDGETGFIVPIRNSSAIAEKIAWGIHQRASLFEMGHAAAAIASKFTWERFRSRLVEAYLKSVRFE